MNVIYVTRNGCLLKESEKLIRKRFKQRKVSMMDVLRDARLENTYAQYHRWLSGRPMPRAYRRYTDALIRSGIVDKLEILGYEVRES